MEQEQIKAIKNHDTDNVATLFATASAGTTVSVLDKAGQTTQLTIISDIPYGHKIALVEIHPGDKVIKYGEQIGVATADIAVGEHVHVQNLDSNRGRGDLDKKKEH
jgi:altronate dehydratase small subunit